jgi:hypothetical protein
MPKKFQSLELFDDGYSNDWNFFKATSGDRVFLKLFGGNDLEGAFVGGS